MIRCDGKRSQRIHDYRPWNGRPFHGLFGCHFNLSPETETEEPCWTSDVTQPRSFPHMRINWRTICNEFINGLGTISIISTLSALIGFGTLIISYIHETFHTSPLLSTKCADHYFQKNNCVFKIFEPVQDTGKVSS